MIDPISNGGNVLIMKAQAKQNKSQINSEEDHLKKERIKKVQEEISHVRWWNETQRNDIGPLEYDF